MQDLCLFSNWLSVGCCTKTIVWVLYGVIKLALNLRYKGLRYVHVHVHVEHE